MKPPAKMTDAELLGWNRRGEPDWHERLKLWTRATLAALDQLDHDGTRPDVPLLYDSITFLIREALVKPNLFYPSGSPVAGLFESMRASAIDPSNPREAETFMVVAQLAFDRYIIETRPEIA